MSAKQEIIHDLKSRGLKITPVRDFLLSFFNKKHRPVSAKDLKNDLAKAGISVNKTTVYRELAFLCAENILTELDFGDGKKRYESANLDHHHHLICEQCDAVEDVVLSENICAVAEKISQKNDFKVTKHTLEFFGVCGKCR